MPSDNLNVPIDDTPVGVVLLDPFHGVVQHLLGMRRFIRHTRQPDDGFFPTILSIHFGRRTLNSLCGRASGSFNAARLPFKEPLPSRCSSMVHVPMIME